MSSKATPKPDIPPSALRFQFLTIRGYGKTTLARALAHDPDVRDAYFDGILWVELGERPENLLSIVSDRLATFIGVDQTGMQCTDDLIERGKRVDPRYLESAEIVHDEQIFEPSTGNIDPHSQFPRGIDTISSPKADWSTSGNIIAENILADCITSIGV
jgi:hypothetical protein